MDIQNVMSCPLIILLGVNILHDEDTIKPGQDGCLKVNLFVYLHELIHSSKHWICSCQH